MLITRRVFVLSLGVALATPVVWAHHPTRDIPATPNFAQDPAAVRGRGPAPPAIGTGMLLGRVVDGTTGRPIPDAIVSMGGRSGGPPRMSAPGTLAPARDVLQSVVTGADGRFVFRDLPPGNYPLRAASPGYVDGSAGQGRPGGPARPIDLADGERLGDVTVRLWKYASVSGTVVDEIGDPAVGLQVQVFRRTMVSGKPQFALNPSAQTDDRGRYRIPRLPPGDYVIGLPQTQSTMPPAVMDSLIESMSNNAAAPPPGFMDLIMSGVSLAGLDSGVRIGDLMWGSSYAGAPPPAGDGRLASYQTVFYPSASSPAQATAVALASGEERAGIDLQLSLVQTARVSGSVTGPSGPMANLGVRLVLVGNDGLSLRSEFDTATAVTRADGTFMLVGVPPGQYIARVLKAPSAMSLGLLATASGGTGQPTAPSTPTLFAELPVSVGTSNVSDLALVLREGARVSGRVEFVGTAPALTPQQLQAISVQLRSLDSSMTMAALRMDPGRIAPNGEFKLAGFQPGRYFVTAAGLGGPSTGPWSMRSATLAGRDVMNEPLELKDTDVTGILITYADKTSQLSGTVRAATPAAAATATVVVFPADYRAWFANGMSAQRVRTIAAKRSGAYVATPLPPGEYLVAALNDADMGDTQDSAFFEALARVATPVTVGEAEQKAQDLQIVKVVR